MKILLSLFFLIGCTKIGSNPEPILPSPPPSPSLQWSLLPTEEAPFERKDHSAVWTGQEWIIWGGRTVPPSPGRSLFDSGAGLDVANEKWIPVVEQGAPEGRFGHSAVWTGEQMLIWGGAAGHAFKNGGKYHWGKKVWEPITEPNNISGRYHHKAVWTGESMFVWGGIDSNQMTLGTGAQYYPTTDTWQLLPERGGPGPRWNHSLTLAGRKILIWGGHATSDQGSGLNDGYYFDLNMNDWAPITITNAPRARGSHSAVYGRKKIFIWGGIGLQESGELRELGDGAIYDLKTGTWLRMSQVKAPSPRKNHVAVWIGRKMLIWGGNRGETYLFDGALYDPDNDKWEKIPALPAIFSKHAGAGGLWTGESFIVWGGALPPSPSPTPEVNKTSMPRGNGATLKFPELMLKED